MSEVDRIGKVNNAMFLRNKMLEEENTKRAALISQIKEAESLEAI